MTRIGAGIFGSIVAVAGWLVSGGLSLAQDNDFWDRPPGGFWELGANWADGSAPGTLDTATFNVAGTYLVEFGTVPQAIRRLSLTAGNVTFNSPGAFRTLNVTSTLFGGPQDVHISNSASLSLGTVDGFVIHPLHLIVGNNLTVGSGATLNVRFGSDVIADALLIDADNPHDATVTITGNGSALVARHVGVGDNATLNVNVGGTVESTSGVIGAAALDEGTAIIDGPGSQWINSNDLIVGDQGGGKLKILGGGRVSNANAFVGRRATSGFIDVNVLVAGDNSTWTVNGRLGVGGDPTTGSDGVGSVGIDLGGNVVVAQDTLIYSRDVLFLAGGTLSTTEISFPTSELNLTPGTFDWSSGTLHVGIYRGDLTVPSGGMLAPGNSAGRTIVFGDYNQEAPFAQLQIEIGGSPASFQFDVLEVRGDVALGGNLELGLLNGFVPAAGNAYSVVTPTGVVSGQFDNVASGQRLRTSDGSGSFVVSYGAGSPFNPTFVVLSQFRATIRGDFDLDDDVDGRDFLVWQRGGSPNPLSASDLAAWRGNFGAPALAATAAVPEPRAELLAVLSTLFSLLYPRNRS